MSAMALWERNTHTCAYDIWLVIQDSSLSIQIHMFRSQLDHNFLNTLKSLKTK